MTAQSHRLRMLQHLSRQQLMDQLIRTSSSVSKNAVHGGA
jgi:hypothetical protein